MEINFGEVLKVCDYQILFVPLKGGWKKVDVQPNEVFTI